jgi:hypothetical protein
MPLSAARALLTAVNDLEQQWALAIEAATDALAPPDEVAARQQRLAVERTWLAKVDWPRLGESGATITVLEAPSKVVRPKLVRSAA